MAGLGDRFKKEGYDKPKPLIDVMGEPMIRRALDSLPLYGRCIFVINKNIEQIEELKSILNEYQDDDGGNLVIIEIDYLTEGPASTCLLAKEYINNGPLLIANCDQIMEWDNEDFLEYITINSIVRKCYDGIVVTYPANTEKNSYVKLNDDGNAIEFAEKKVISEHSLNGIHYWKNGLDFVNSAERMIQKNIRVNNEFYIAPTYNEMILDGKRIGIYPIESNEHWAVGTPEDLKKYLEHASV